MPNRKFPKRNRALSSWTRVGTGIRSALRVNVMPGLIRVLSDLRPVSLSLRTRLFRKVKIMADFPGPKWIAPDYDHLGP